MSETWAVRTDDGKCRWDGPMPNDFLPQLPDKWPWKEDRLPWKDAWKRLESDWDSKYGPLKFGKLAQRSERIGMQGWFGTRLGGTPDDPNERRRYPPELYAATFAWVQAEQALRATRVAITVSIVASAIAVASVVVAVIGLDDSDKSAATPTATATVIPSTPTPTP